MHATTQITKFIPNEVAAEHYLHAVQNLLTKNGINAIKYAIIICFLVCFACCGLFWSLLKKICVKKHRFL
jgi:hypothetical protein